MASQKKAAAAERKRPHFRTREAMDFDLPPTVLYNQQDVVYYLKKHHAPLPPGIVVEWCDPNTNHKVLPSEGGVYFHLQVLAFGVHLPLRGFVHRVLAYCGFASTQLAPDAWRTLLAF